MNASADFLRRKTTVPGELLSSDWRAVDGWVRERAFFMAGVAEAATLQGFRDIATRREAGELGQSEAREAAQELLSKLGYVPRDGQEGTIKDLGTFERQRVSLETNVEVARGFALRARQQEVLGEFPAWDYVRMRHSKVPRDWLSRWRAAGGGSAGSTPGPRMAALVNHPIWTHPDFNALGNPYPPFDFNSGMGVEALDRQEALELGLLDGDVAGMLEPDPVLESLNRDLEVAPAVRDEHLWQDLMEDLLGFAVRRDDVLVFTDPNGTRPYSAVAVAEVLDAPLPRGFKNHQREAVAAWSRQSRDILENPGGDAAHHLMRLVERTEPLATGTPIFRGESFESEAAMLARVKSLLSKSELNALATSFSKDATIAQTYSSAKGHRIIFRIEEHLSMKSIEETVARAYPQNANEREVLAPHKMRIEVVSAHRIDGGFELLLREVAE